MVLNKPSCYSYSSATVDSRFKYFHHFRNKGCECVSRSELLTGTTGNIVINLLCYLHFNKWSARQLEFWVCLGSFFMWHINVLSYFLHCFGKGYFFWREKNMQWSPLAFSTFQIHTLWVVCSHWHPGITAKIKTLQGSCIIDDVDQHRWPVKISHIKSHMKLQFYVHNLISHFFSKQLIDKGLCRHSTVTISV